MLINCGASQDRTDTQTAAKRIHSQYNTGKYQEIYREASARFKSIGSESKFISMMHQFNQENGAIQTANEINYETGFYSDAGRVYIITFKLEYEKGHAKERMVFTRSESGQMQLWKLDTDPLD